MNSIVLQSRQECTQVISTWCPPPLRDNFNDILAHAEYARRPHSISISTALLDIFSRHVVPLLAAAA